jgi:hypothetical protein
MDETRIIAAVLSAGILSSFQRSTIDPDPEAKNAVNLFRSVVRELDQGRSSMTKDSKTL